MAETTQIKNSAKVDTDTQLRLFRERMAAVIAILIIGGGLALVGLTLIFVGDAERFGRAKDLLLFVNPLLGVAVGYFFNKVTSDARAENAERSVEVASNAAQQATEVKNAAVAESESLRGETVEMKTALEDLASSAQSMLMQPEEESGAPGKLGLGADSGKSGPSPEQLKARLELESSMKRAQKWVSSH